MYRGPLLTLLVLKLAAIGLACGGLWTAALVLFFAPDLWVFYNLFVPSAQGLCRNFTAFETPGNDVWLTIDDGPDPEDTPRILDLLDRHQARATFFVIGERAAKHPELVRAIIARGHEVGHHTQTHPGATLWCAGRARLNAELDQAMAVFSPLVPRLRWFRAPVGIKNFFLPRALARRDLQCVGWTIRSGDCLGRTPEAVRAKVARHLRPGAIILMHEGPSVPAALRLTALTQVLEMLAAQNFRCVLPNEECLK